jgi:hypothetical protein
MNPTSSGFSQSAKITEICLGLTLSLSHDNVVLAAGIIQFVPFLEFYSISPLSFVLRIRLNHHTPSTVDTSSRLSRICLLG